MPGERYQHIFLDGPSNEEEFSSIPTRGAKKRIPLRDRQVHSDFLSRKLADAWSTAEHEQAVTHVARHGVYLEFKSDPGADLVTKSLEDMRSKQVRLLNVRKVREPQRNEITGEVEEKETTYATVYVSHEKKGHFLKKLQSYAEQETPKGNPRHQDLVNSIGDIRKALLVDSFWQDFPNLKPADEAEWYEVWLSNHTDEVIERFEALLTEEEIKARDGVIKFPERAVKVIFANLQQLERLTTLSDDIAEYRRAKETSAFWTDMANRDQAEWVEDLQSRSHVDPDSNVTVCVLDTGVNNGHPLLAPLLPDAACLTVNPAWGVHDHDLDGQGHGTRMAGVAAYGDLQKCLEIPEPLFIKHRLESVKILPPPPDVNPPELWGYITSQGVSRAEIEASNKKRVICMAVTASDTRDSGRPSSWSGALDQLAAGADEENDDRQRRLLILSAGNLTNLDNAVDYPVSQCRDSVHDPGQSWNALTVGAYTSLDRISDSSYEGYTPIAPSEGLSPFSTTSSTWENRWPLKPEIVMEGGNLAHDGQGFVTECEDLSLLSTFWKPTDSHFSPFNMTSAAAAQAAWFAAQIQASYPDMWPETVRALMVHSAEWTDTLKTQFLADSSKTAFADMIRICGYGVPNLERALYSAANSLTLLAESELQPYAKRGSGGFKTNEMHFYELPWPKDILFGLPHDVQVQMRITLSYFIEPGPGEIGWQDRYRYASHALRFRVNSPGETREDFLKRINAAARAEDEEHPGTRSDSDHWVIGSKTRDKGSIHSDIWQGTAAELAASNLVAVYPVIGWWRERSHMGRWNRRTRYALVVSITTPEESVDIYTPVANQVGITIPVTVET